MVAEEARWEKLFQNLRSTWATELSERYPAQVVAAWLCHSVEVGAKHYMPVTDEQFATAIKDDAHSDARCAETAEIWAKSGTRKNEKTRISAGLSRQPVPPQGGEQPANSARKQGRVSRGDVNSDASSTGVAVNPAESRCLLARLAAAWNRLTDPDRAEVVKLSERLATHPSHPTSSDSN